MSFRPNALCLSLLLACGDSAPPIDGGPDEIDFDASYDAWLYSMHDSGPDVIDTGPVDAFVPPTEIEPACERLCATSGTLSDSIEIPVASSVYPGRYNVRLTAGMRSHAGTVFATVAEDCCAEDAGEVLTGIVRVDRRASAAITLFGPEPQAIWSLGSPAFFLQGRPAVLRGNDRYDQVSLVDEVDLTSVATIDVSGLGLAAALRTMAPVFASRDGGALVMWGDAAELRPLDVELAPVGGAEPYGLVGRARRGALVRTCGGGIVALVVDEAGALHSRRLAPDGAPLDGTPTVVGTGLETGPWAPLDALWDGERIVIAAGRVVIELDAQGELVGQTPIEGATILAAAGAGDALIVLEDVDWEWAPGLPLPPPPRVTRRERGTGRLLEVLGSVDTYTEAYSGAMGLAEGRIDVVATSYDTRDRVVASSLSCEP